MARRIAVVAFAAGVTAGTALLAQQPPPVSGARFDVISITLNKNRSPAMGMFPDGTFTATDMRIRQIITVAGPEDVVDVMGLPDWAMRERYDIIAKPAPQSHPTPDERRQMMHNMMIERFKVAGHLEEADRDGFALVVAREDGRLGPGLKASTRDCRGADRDKCGGRTGLGQLEMNGMVLDDMTRFLARLAGAPVTNRTGLDGFYDATLHFTRQLRADPTAPPEDGPSIFTALQEQLGLKLVPEKTKVKVFVIDHIERPTPN